MSILKSVRRPRHAVRDHLPRWMLELTTDASEILAASPYVSEGRLFKKCAAKVASLYTVFNALNFISGASSLRVLKGLLSKGVAIYHVEALHAKVVIIDGEHFSLGSQNLTVRGRCKNVEASYVGGSETPSKDVRDFFERIQRNARPITLQDIGEMEKLVEPWIKKFKEIEQAADGIDQHLEAKRKLRETLKKRMRAALERKRHEEQEQAEREAEERVKRQLAENEKREAAKRVGDVQSERMRRAVLMLNQFLDAAPSKPDSRLIASVHRLKNQPKEYFGRVTQTDSLKPVDRSRNFCQLLMAVGVTPQMKYRYLVLDRDTCKLGFVRFNKTQWTYFGAGVSPAETVAVDGIPWNIEIRFDWSRVKNLPRNGNVILYVTNFGSSKRIQIASMGFVFSVAGIELEDLLVEPSEKIGHYWNNALMVKMLESEKVKEALKKYLPNHLTRQFKFTRNLHGKQAFDFFGQRHPTTYLVEAHRKGNTVVFSVRRDPPLPLKSPVMSFEEMGFLDF